MLTGQWLTPFRVMVLALAAFPGVWVAAFYNYVLAARVYLGYWPQYNRPDPKRLGWWLSPDALWIGLICLPYVVGLAFCLIVIGRYRSREFPTLLMISVLIGSFGMLLACTSTDPGGF